MMACNRDLGNAIVSVLVARIKSQRSFIYTGKSFILLPSLLLDGTQYLLTIQATEPLVGCVCSREEIERRRVQMNDLWIDASRV
jgi:hypothetical protein